MSTSTRSSCHLHHPCLPGSSLWIVLAIISLLYIGSVISFTCKSILQAGDVESNPGPALLNIHVGNATEHVRPTRVPKLAYFVNQMWSPSVTIYTKYMGWAKIKNLKSEKTQSLTASCFKYDLHVSLLDFLGKRPEGVFKKMYMYNNPGKYRLKKKKFCYNILYRVDNNIVISSRFGVLCCAQKDIS